MQKSLRTEEKSFYFIRYKQMQTTNTATSQLNSVLFWFLFLFNALEKSGKVSRIVTKYGCTFISIWRKISAIYYIVQKSYRIQEKTATQMNKQGFLFLRSNLQDSYIKGNPLFSLFSNKLCNYIWILYLFSEWTFL